MKKKSLRVVVLFAPGFQAFGKTFMKLVQEKKPGAEIIGLAVTRRTYAALRKDKSCEFAFLDCLEDREQEWLATPYNPQELKSYEDALGTKVVSDILILDRLVGGGFVSGALPIETELTRRARNHDAARAYVTGMLRYFSNLCDEQKPDAAFIYAIAGGAAGALLWTMQARDMPVLKLQHTRIDDRFLVDTSSHGLLDPVWARYFNGEKARRECREAAELWLEAFRARDKKPEYFLANMEKRRKAASPLRVAGRAATALARLGYYAVYPAKKQLRAEDGFFRFRESIMVPWRSRRMRRESFYSDFETLKNADFIYFPMHLDPEAATMHLAPDLTDQTAVIEALAKRRPLHMNLLVKEHPNMIGRRPPGFYERLRALPGVYLISPSVPGRELLKRAKLTFTITGTAAWEAMAWRKPAAIMGNATFLPFARLGMGLKVARLGSLADDILEALQMEPVPDEELLRYLGLLYEESFTLSSQLFWGEVGDKAVQGNIQMVEAMAAQFLERLADYEALVAAAA